MTKVIPVEEHHLVEVSRFLHENLNRRFSPETWAASLTHRWAESQPNFGMQLQDDDGRVVGVFCAIYSDQLIDGRIEKFCNPHSWCVLDSHRHSSINLLLRLLKQPGYHFTMFSPNPKVAKVFLGFRFRTLDDRVSFFPNLPSPWPRSKERFLESDPERIALNLQGPLLRDFSQHRGIPWLNFVAFGQPNDSCLAVYKRGRWKRMPCARILHISDPGVMERHGHLLCHHLLMDRGLLVSQVEGRFLTRIPKLSYRARREQPKLVLSNTLADSAVRELYSELVALDL